MSNIEKHRPYLYLGKTETQYHIGIAIQIEARQSVAYSRTGRTITCAITTGIDADTSLIFYTHRESFSIPSPDYGETDDLNIIVTLNASTITRDYCLGMFVDADVIDDAPTGGEPLPHLLVMIQNTDPLECVNSVVILPEDDLLVEEESLLRTSDGNISSSITIDSDTGNIVNDKLVFNNIFLDNPLTGNYSEVEMFSGGGKKKRVKIPQQGA